MIIRECYKLIKETNLLYKRRFRLIKIRTLLLDEVRYTLDNNTYPICEIDLYSIETIIANYQKVLDKQHDKLKED